MLRMYFFQQSIFMVYIVVMEAQGTIDLPAGAIAVEGGNNAMSLVAMYAATLSFFDKSASAVVLEQEGRVLITSFDKVSIFVVPIGLPAAISIICADDTTEGVIFIFTAFLVVLSDAEDLPRS